jgi:PTS system mannose-specific IIB component/fructoselysine and glucoselysine-specific PTS system IIB component
VTLVLHRIDDRLIHGQVVVGWGQPLDIRFIVLVDNEVAGSEWEQELYRMGVPPEMDVYFLSVSNAITELPRLRQDTRQGILLTGDIDTMRQLVEAGGIATVNLGGIHHRTGRTQRLRYVFLNNDEESALREIATLGVAISAQDVPGARPVPLDDILAGVAS